MAPELIKSSFTAMKQVCLIPLVIPAEIGTQAPWQMWPKQMPF